MTAFIQKSSGTYRLGFYVICKILKSNVFFSRYSAAKEFCEGHGWTVVRI